MTVKNIAVASATAAIVLLSTAAAFAQPGVATGAVNVRTGPGTGYSKVGTLSAGEYVDVKDCQGSWCFVDRNSGTDGWVSASYLQPANPQPQPQPQNDDIPFNFGVTVGPGGPSFSFGIGDAPPPAPVPVPVAPEVCFYKSMGYSGAEFCVPAGSVDNQLMGSWNDRISSIKLIGGAEVQICEDWWSGGSCVVLHNSKPNLGGFDNITSSYQTW
jgi:hypothetical protein